MFMFISVYCTNLYFTRYYLQRQLPRGFTSRQVTCEKLIYIAKEMLLNRRSEYYLVELVNITQARPVQGSDWRSSCTTQEAYFRSLHCWALADLSLSGLFSRLILQPDWNKNLCNLMKYIPSLHYTCFDCTRGRVLAKPQELLHTLVNISYEMC